MKKSINSRQSPKKRLLSATIITLVLVGIGVVFVNALTNFQAQESRDIDQKEENQLTDSSKQPSETTKPNNTTTVKEMPTVVLETTMGDIHIELNNEKAPITVENFLRYVESGFYSETVFHRVIPNFMIQGGGLTEDLKGKEDFSPIKNEANNGLSNLRGTIAMARTQIVHSATSQFFINVVDNPHLDYREDTASGYGYCVFGRVIEGMDVVDKIVGAPTHTVGYYSDVPLEPIIIKDARLSK